MNVAQFQVLPHISVHWARQAGSPATPHLAMARVGKSGKVVTWALAELVEMLKMPGHDAILNRSVARARWLGASGSLRGQHTAQHSR